MNTQYSKCCCLCGGSVHGYHNCTQNKSEDVGYGYSDSEKNDAVQDPVILEDEGNPTAHNYEYGVPGDDNNRHLCKIQVQDDPSLYNYELLPPSPKPETRLTTQA